MSAAAADPDLFGYQIGRGRRAHSDEGFCSAQAAPFGLPLDGNLSILNMLNKVPISARGLHLRYGNIPVLQDLNLQVEPGEFFALLGPSGSGKSSLLRILAGFLKPDSGSVIIDGEDLTAVPAHLRRVGMVFQNYALWPHMNVFDNVAFGLVEAKVPRDERNHRVDSILSLLGLGGFQRRRPSTLSGGQQQRVALARSLVMEPRVLLLDEPFSNLDRQLRVQMRQDLRSIQQTFGITTVFVTHDQEEALTIADRVAVLNNGVLQQTGTSAALFDFPANRFVANFVGTTNLLSGEVTVVNTEMVVFNCVGMGLISVPRTPQFSVDCGPALMTFRPHQVEIRVGDEQVDASRVWFSGHVLAGEFIGEFSRYRVQCGELTLIADQPHYSGIPMFPVGMRVRLGIEPAQVRFLKA